MKANIVGVGAIGGVIAGELAEAGWEVSLFARGANLAALQAHGLRVRHKGSERNYRLPASDDPADLPKPDYVILAVKGHHVADVAPAVAAMLGPETAVVSALNGITWWFFALPRVPLSGVTLESVDPGGAILRALPVERVIGCVVHTGALTPGPGISELTNADRLIFGEPDGRLSPRVEALSAAFAATRVKPVASDAIRADIWSKLWGNLPVNPVSALTGARSLAMFGDADVRRLLTDMMVEMRAVGDKIGLPLAMTPDERIAVAAALGNFKTSMLQDVEAGRPLEIGPIVSAVVEIAERVGVPVPMIRAVHGLIRVKAAGLGAA